ACRRIDIPAVTRFECGVGIAAQRVIRPVVPCPAEKSVCTLGESIPHHPFIFGRIVVEKAPGINAGAVVDGRLQPKRSAVRSESPEQTAFLVNMAESYRDIIDPVRE